MIELTPTAWTALGYLAMRPSTGYEIKQRLEESLSVNLFWGISYGQLYPQLKHLSELGLIAAGGEQGRRGTVWEVTTAGQEALREWLLHPAAPPQVRDEGLIKLLFAGTLTPEDTLRLIEQRRWHARWMLERISERTDGNQSLAVDLVADYGVATAKATLAWCDQAEHKLRESRP